MTNFGGKLVKEPESDNADGQPLQDLVSDDKYIGFPGGIPKRWLEPAFYIFTSVFVGYALWIILGEIREGGESGTSSLKIAESIVTHLSAFTVLLTITLIICCKGLERIMYYLDAKRLAEQERQRAEQERQRAEQAEQRAEQAEQRAEQLLEELKKERAKKKDS